MPFPYFWRKTPHRSGYPSKFGGLWIDRSDAPQRIAKDLSKGTLTTQDADNLVFFRENGFLILEKAVSSELVDKFLNAIGLTDQRFLVVAHDKNIQTADKTGNAPGLRFPDIHVNVPSALELMFAHRVQRFLELIFDSEPLAFQTLYFKYGSEQGLHQDTAYVVVDPPMHLAASWIALEDIKEGSGELIYNVGSHRNDEFSFAPGRKHFLVHQDGVKRHSEYSLHLDEQRQKHSQQQRTFRARKGDALIWAADLAHGGRAVTATPTPTRQSLVTHYCPAAATPHSFTFGPNACVQVDGGGRYSSVHYDLREPGTPKSPLLRI